MKPEEATNIGDKPDTYRNALAAAMLRGEIARQLRKLRKARGWTQIELGRRAGLRQERISRLENPAFRRMRFEELERIASALDVSFEARFVAREDASLSTGRSLR